MEGTAMKKMAQKKKHCSRRVRNQRRICLGRLWRYADVNILGGSVQTNKEKTEEL
jgi:hypothetical protein